MKFKLFGCPSLRRELFLLASLSPHDVDVELLPSPVDTALLQSRIDRAVDCDYILPCVGSCLAEGLTAGNIPLALPRAHNCAHLLLGSIERYRRIFSENDDEPRWRFFDCARLCSEHGSPCTVRDTLIGSAAREDTREYAADLSLLRDYLNGNWDDRFLIVSPRERVALDPVEILCAEPRG